MQNPVLGSRVERAFPYLLLIPTVVIFAIVLVYPLGNGIVLAFTSYTIIRPEYSWVGIENFARLFQNPVYWQVVANSVGIVFTAVIFQLLIGLTVALLLNRKVAGRGLFRGLIFSIWIIPTVVIAQLWMIILNSEVGILNYVLTQLGVIPRFLPWRGTEWLARLSLTVVYVWRGIPFFMVMIIAALQSVPADLMDSAKIDGANVTQRFRYVTLPCISGILVLCALLSTVRLFQNVDIIFVLTGGGPIYATTTLALDVYRRAFVGFRMGQAAAVGVTWMVLLMGLAIVYVRRVTRQ